MNKSLLRTGVRRRAAEVAFGRIVVALILATVPIATACGDGGASDDASPDDGSAIMVVNRVLTPDGRSIIVNLVPSMAPVEIDLSQGLEVSGLSRARVFDGKLFIFDGETGRVIRYAAGVEDGFVEEDRFSMARLGIQRFISSTTFLSPTRAVYIDSSGEQVVLFDPSAMAVLDSYPLPQLRDGLTDLSVRVNAPARVGNELMTNVRNFDVTTGEFDPRVRVIVFSENADRVLRVVEDSRCFLGESAFVDRDRFYVVGDYVQGTFDQFGITIEDVPPPCLLRLSPGATTFDPDFLVNLEEVASAPFVATAARVTDGVIAFQAWGTEIVDPAALAPDEFASAPAWRWTLLDYEAGRATPLDATALPAGETTPFGPFLVDNELYVPVFDPADFSSELLLIDDNGSVSPSLQSTAQIIGVERLR